MKAKAKLFFLLPDGGWSERGVVRLQLRRPLAEGAPGCARLLARNDTGKLLLNATLYAGLKTTAKARGCVAKLVNAAQGGADGGQAVVTMLRVASDADAARLHALMEQNTPARG